MLPPCHWKFANGVALAQPRTRLRSNNRMESNTLAQAQKFCLTHSLLSSSTTSCLYLSERNDRFLVMHHQHAKGGKGRISCSIVVSPTYRSDSSFLSCWCRCVTCKSSPIPLICHYKGPKYLLPHHFVYRYIYIYIYINIYYIRGTRKKLSSHWLTSLLSGWDTKFDSQQKRRKKCYRKLQAVEIHSPAEQ